MIVISAATPHVVSLKVQISTTSVSWYIAINPANVSLSIPNCKSHHNQFFLTYQGQQCTFTFLLQLFHCLTLPSTQRTWSPWHFTEYQFTELHWWYQVYWALWTGTGRRFKCLRNMYSRKWEISPTNFQGPATSMSLLDIQSACWYHWPSQSIKQKVWNRRSQVISTIQGFIPLKSIYHKSAYLGYPLYTVNSPFQVSNICWDTVAQEPWLSMIWPHVAIYGIKEGDLDGRLRGGAFHHPWESTAQWGPATTTISSHSLTTD